MSNLWHTKDAVIHILELGDQKEGFLVLIINKKADGMVRSLGESVKPSNFTMIFLGVAHDSPCSRPVTNHFVSR